MDIIFSKFFMTTYTETQGLPVEKGTFHKTITESNYSQTLISWTWQIKKKILKDLRFRGEIIFALICFHKFQMMEKIISVEIFGYYVCRKY